MTSTFGERLRLHREERKISLSAVSEQTKIKLSLLDALERDDLSHWPLGLFGRSYIRSYAQAIGLDPAATLREFLERHPGSTGAVADPLSEVQAVTPEKASRRPPTRLEVPCETTWTDLTGTVPPSCEGRSVTRLAMPFESHSVAITRAFDGRSERRLCQPLLRRRHWSRRRRLPIRNRWRRGSGPSRSRFSRHRSRSRKASTWRQSRISARDSASRRRPKKSPRYSRRRP